MKTALHILCFLIANSTMLAQSKIDSLPINDILLNSTLDKYARHLYLITGKERVYQQNEWLKKSIEKNIKNGIREGVCNDGSLNKIEDYKASKTSLFFYDNSLYKVRWLFRADDYSDLKKLSSNLIQYLTNKYGSVSEKGPFGMLIWNGNKNYIQFFFDESELQIEYRDNQIHHLTSNLE